MTAHRLSLLAAASATMLGGTAAAQDFRVESRVYVGAAAEPVSHTLTLFSRDAVYDFQFREPLEVVVLQPTAGKLVVLDPVGKAQTAITLQKLDDIALELQRSGPRSKQPFLYAPVFRVQFEERDERLTLSSDVLTYRVQGLRPTAEGPAARYADFTGWCARLNATRPGALPPFARLELNRNLAERGLLPAQIELRLTPGGGREPLTVRSSHEFGWVLTPDDRQRLAQAERLRLELPHRRPDEYRKLQADAEEARRR